METLASEESVLKRWKEYIEELINGEVKKRSSEVVETKFGCRTD